MTKKEFQEIINIAEQKLVNNDTGVCVSIKTRPCVAKLFQAIFRPDYMSWGYWLGSQYDKRNKKKRLLFLRMFEEVVISEGDYKDIRKSIAKWEATWK